MVRAAARHPWPSSRIAAARTVAGLGRRHCAEAAGILRAVLAGPAESDSVTSTAPARSRTDTDAGAELAALGPCPLER